MAENVIRYQVRKGSQTWNDNGADLFRPRDNARKQLSSILGAPEDMHKPAYNKGDGWIDCSSKADVMDAFDAWRGASAFKVAERRDALYDTVAVVMQKSIPFLALDNSSPGTSLVHSLIQARFPGVKFSGGYVWKTISGTTMWSDHAWGTAVDESQNVEKGVKNDDVTDWISRMARTGNMDFDYALGSRDGNVVICSAPEFNLEASGASTSHLWHVHISIVDHDGRKPPRTGGVW